MPSKVLRLRGCIRYESMKNYVRRLKAKATRTGRKSSPHVAERTDAQKDARGKSW